MAEEEHVTPVIKDTACSTELRTSGKSDLLPDKLLSKAMEQSLMVASPQIPKEEENPQEFENQGKEFSMPQRPKTPLADSKMAIEEEKDYEKVNTIDSDDEPEEKYFSEADQKALKQQFINRLLEMTRMAQNNKRVII